MVGGDVEMSDFNSEACKMTDVGRDGVGLLVFVCKGGRPEDNGPMEPVDDEGKMIAGIVDLMERDVSVGED